MNVVDVSVQSEGLSCADGDPVLGHAWILDWFERAMPPIPRPVTQTMETNNDPLSITFNSWEWFLSNLAVCAIWQLGHVEEDKTDLLKLTNDSEGKEIHKRLTCLHFI